MSGPGTGGPQAGQYGGAPQHPAWVNTVIFGGIGVIIVLVIGIGVVLVTSGGDADDEDEPQESASLGGDPTGTSTVPADDGGTGQSVDTTVGNTTEGDDTSGGGVTAAEVENATADEHVYLEDLEVGTCALAPNTEELTRIGTVDCSGWYDFEVYHIEPLADTIGTEWPGEGEVDSSSRSICEENFETYIGLPEADSELEINYLTPIESSWEYRTEVTCLVGDPAAPTQGSLEGANR